jgi:hypothetical protein
LGIFAGTAHSIRGIWINGFHFRPWFPFFPLWSLSLFFLIVWAYIIVWVYKDAERRGMNGVLWALLVFIGNLIGLLIFLIIRQEHRPASPGQVAPAAPAPKTCCACPSCQQPIEKNHTYCPHCGATIQQVCASCGKPAETAWKVCPHCGSPLKKE